MTDVLTPEQRHKCMASIRGKHTKPELIVRKLVHALGFRYRLHRSDLPGKPDLVLSRVKKIIFVNGCFWHMHRCRYGQVKPKTNAMFWQEKREATRERDIRNRKAVRKMGWDVFVVWECWTKDVKKLQERLWNYLKP